MRQRISKELRHLLPAWAAAFVLWMVSLMVFTERDGFAVWLACFGLGAVFLSVKSFGTEFNENTLILYLSQPLSRNRLWLEKMGVLCCLILFLSIGLVACVWLKFGTGSFLELFVLAWFVISVSAIGGGVLFTLLFRQVHAAIWFSILLPLALGFVAESAASKFLTREQVYFAWLSTLAVYGISGVILGFYCFRKFQDAELLRVELGIPGWLRLGSGFLDRVGLSTATRALVGKEIHLQQMNMIVAGLLYGLYLLVFALKTGSEEQGISWDLVRALFLFLWCLLPGLIGAAAVAEERRLGTLEQVLPVCPKRQWGVKVSCVYALSVLLGAVIPWILYAVTSGLGATIPWALNPLLSSFGVGAEQLEDDLTVRLSALAVLVLIAVAIATSSLYASSQARNLLESLGLMVALAIMSVCVILLMMGFTVNLQPRPWLLMSLLAVPLFFLPLRMLSFRNYLAHLVTNRLRLSNLGVVVACYAAVVLATTAIYFRAWEWVWFQAPPRPGVQLTGKLKPNIALSPRFVLALTPDGGLWAGGNLPLKLSTNRASTLQPARVAGSAEWKEIDGSYPLSAGVRADGTLWSWGYRWLETDGVRSSRRVFHGPLQIGADADWHEVACGNEHVLALKTDGSLWAWGKNRYGELGDGTLAEKDVPVRVAGEWQTIAAQSHSSAGIQKDGTLWKWGRSEAAGSWKQGRYVPPVQLVVPTQVGQQTNWLEVSIGEGYPLGIQQDGSLWCWGHGPWFFFNSSAPPASTDPVPVAADDRWLAAAGSWDGAMAIKADGSLWQWQRSVSSPPGRKSQPVRVGRRTDWIAITSSWGVFVGMTADGGLWAWNYPFVDPARQLLLRPTRRPNLLGYLTLSRDAN